MNERTCKKCGRVDFDIWGPVGLFGFALMIGALGYSLAIFPFYPPLIMLGLIFGFIFMLPMWFISYHEEKAGREELVEKPR